MDYDNEELEILEDFEKGAYKSVANLDAEIKLAKETAENYFTKDSRINIRLSSTDLNLLKRLAVQEGLPYQTFISSILHKFATGRLSNS